MNAAAWATLLLLAIALAIQPWSVLAAVLLVTSRQGVRKEVAYVLGWLLALSAVAIATVVLYPAKPKPTSTSAALSAIDLGAGVVLTVWAIVRWRRPVKPTSSEQPKWMSRIDTMSPALAMILGAFLPNYVLVAAAVTNVLELGLSQTSAALVIFGWVVIASLGVAAPLFVLLARPDSAAAIYAGWRAWLVANGQRVLVAVVGVIGVVLAAKGLAGLWS